MSHLFLCLLPSQLLLFTPSPLLLILQYCPLSSTIRVFSLCRVMKHLPCLRFPSIGFWVLINRFLFEKKTLLRGNFDADIFKFRLRLWCRNRNSDVNQSTAKRGDHRKFFLEHRRNRSIFEIEADFWYRFQQQEIFHGNPDLSF
jgi:hypothetical protein